MYNKANSSERFEKLANIDLRSGIEEKFGYANVLYQKLLEQIIQFQSQLDSNEEVGAYLASFGQKIYLHIEQVSYKDPYYIIFSGTLENGQKAQLVQHTSQSNILLVAVKIEPEANRAPYRIGFRIDND